MIKVKFLKPVFALVSSLLLIHCTEVFATTVTQNTAWDFTSVQAQTVTDEYYMNDLTVIGDENEKTKFDGKRLILGAAGSTEKTCIKFRVRGSCRISTELSSGGYVDRKLALSNGTQILDELYAPSKPNIITESYVYTGGETDIYLYSKSSGININNVCVDFYNLVEGDVTGDDIVDEEDAHVILRHILGSRTLTDRLPSADYDGNGAVELTDVIKILNHLEEGKYEAENINVDTSDGIEVSSYSGLTYALRTAGIKIYITDDIEVEDRIQLGKGNQSIIGVPKADGSLPILDFKDMAGKIDIINNSSNDGDVGLKVTSSGNTIENLVVENAHDNGIQIKGVDATDNTVRNCILRYNNDSGLQMAGGAHNNTAENIISYRNCDVYTRGANADGFAVKLGAGIANTTDEEAVAQSANSFINCYAWENGDDGWDSYDDTSQTFQTYNVSYQDCMCWSNGTPYVHMGYTDYIKGLPLDEDLPFIRRIATIDPENYQKFKTAYNYRTLCSSTATKEEYGAAVDYMLSKKIKTNAGELSVTELLDPTNWKGNPNGFKLGSSYSEEICVRTLTNCIAFDHNNKGIDRNNASCNVSITNCLSFNNGRNYKLDTMNITHFENIFGWNGTDNDNLPTGFTVDIPTDYSSKESKIRTASQVMINYAEQNMIGKTNIFTTVFS